MKINSKRIRVLMDGLAFTQGELAARAGMSRATVNNLLAKGSCSTGTGTKLAEALGVPLSEIINRE